MASRLRRLCFYIFTIQWLLAACSAPLPPATPTPTGLPTAAPPSALPSPEPTSTPLPTAAPTATHTPAPTATPTRILWSAENTPLPPDLAVIRFLNAPSVSALAEWQEENVTDLAWSPDSQLLAVGNYAGISLYQVETRQRLRTLETEEGIVSLAYSPRGNFLAAGFQFGSAEEGYSGKVDFWRTSNWERLGVLYGDTRAVGQITFAPAGRNFAVAFASSDYWQNSVILWDTYTWEITRTLTTGTVQDIAFSPDGQLLAVTPDRYAIKVYQTKDGLRVTNVHTSFTGAVNSIVFAPGGARFATGHYDGSIRLWDTAKGEQVLQLPGEGVVESLAFNLDGTVLSAGYSYQDNAIRLWDADTGILLRTLEGHTAGVDSLAFSPSGNLLASASYDGLVRLWGLRP